MLLMLAPCAAEEVCACYLPWIASCWLPLSTTPAGNKEQTECTQLATAATPASKHVRAFWACCCLRGFALNSLWGVAVVGVAQSCLAHVPIACRSGSSVLSLLALSLPQTLFGFHAWVSPELFRSNVENKVTCYVSKKDWQLQYYNRNWTHVEFCV